MPLGDPRQMLIEMSAGASVLVLGNRGRGAVASLLLGSVSVALATHAPCPVVVARPYPHSAAQADLPVVVGADGTPDSADALTFAIELASAQHRPLLAVHALGEAWMYPYPDVLGPDMVSDAKQDWELLLAESLAGYAEKFPDVVVHTQLVQGTPAHALVNASETAAAVVVGARGSSLLRGPLGSVSRSVVEHAHCTVAVMRDTRESVSQ
jgi:nucleotide-binding universal stress UspA family protein